jgi:phage-related protein
VDKQADPKPLHFVGDSDRTLRTFPGEVRSVMGQALWAAQIGKKHPDAKPLKGFPGASVLEIVSDFATDTYRGVYTVKLAGVVYVLHTFQKKSKRGIQTSKQDVTLIRQRLKAAEQHYQEHYTQGNKP